MSPMMSDMYGFVFAGLGPYAARAFSFLTAATTTWALNRRFTFLTEWLTAAERALQ